MATVVVSSGSAQHSNKFTQMWEAADLDFHKETGRSLRTRSGASQTTLVRLFLERLAPDELTEGDKRRRKKAMEVVGFVLGFVKTVGGFAASAASMVFGPADMCFNAFAFLIDIPKKINKVYDDLIRLFSDMSAVPLEFEVLGKISLKKVELDDQLLTTSNNLLIAFVNICAKYIKFLSRSKVHFITTAFKSVFLDDDCGVLAELQKFQRLARQQSSMIGTVSFEHTINIQEAILEHADCLQEFREEFKEGQHLLLRGMETIMTDNKDRKEELLIQKALNVIEEKLRVRSVVSDKPLNDLAQKEEESIKGVCQWVYETEEYQKWIDVTTKRHLLYIAGGAKTGKTFLLAEIARRLRSQNAGDMALSVPHPVLYYTFPKPVKGRVLDSKKDTAIDLALKHLALQYARQNLKYAENLKLSLNKSDIPEKEYALRLFAGFCESLRSPNCRLYILLGGLDNLSLDQSQKMVNLFKEQRDIWGETPKILITGSSSFFAQLTSSFYLRIDIENHNEVGIRQYINSEINEVESLQGSHSAIKRLRNALLKKLTTESKGSFGAIRQKLARVGAAIDDNKTEAEVLATLDHVANSSSEKLVKEKIEKLEKDLSTSDIEDLNKMLPWLLYGFNIPFVYELEALLHLYCSDSPVLPLEKRLQNKFSTIIDCQQKVVQLPDEVKEFLVVQLSDEVKEFLIRSTGRSNKPGNTASSISLQLNINCADKVLVKRFLWDLTRAFDLDNPTFVDFPTFVDLRSEFQRPRIGVTEADAHFAMIEKCFQFLGEDTDKIANKFGPYSLLYLPDHIDGFRNCDPAPGHKRLVCQKLIHFFSEPDILEQKWCLAEWHLRWIDPSKRVTQNIEFLFIDTLPLLEPKERRWVAKNVQKSGGRGLFWQPITEMVAKKWLRERDWGVENSFKWIDHFIELQSTKMVQNSNEHNNAETNSDSDESGSREQGEKLSACDRILRAAEWSLDNVAEIKADVTYSERLASNFLAEEKFDMAIEYLEKAQSMDTSSWRICQKLAQAYSKLSRKNDARVQLKAAIEGFQNSEYSTDQKIHIELLADLARVEQASDLVGEEAALKHFKQILDMNPTDTTYFKEYIGLMQKRSDVDGVRHALSPETKPELAMADSNLSKIQLKRLMTLVGMDQISDSFMRFMIMIMTDHEISGTIMETVHSLMDETDPDDDWAFFEKLGFLCNMGHIFSNMKLSGIYKAGLLCLEKCLKAVQRYNSTHSSEFGAWFTYHCSRRSVRQLSLCRSLAIESTHPGQSGLSPEWDDFEDTIRNRDKHNTGWVRTESYLTPKTYLCMHYVMDKNYDKARELMLPTVKDALTILEDEDPENDDDGYWMLGEAFKLTGDDINALTAWSMIVPTDIGNDTVASKPAHDLTDKAEVNQHNTDPATTDGETSSGPAQRPGKRNHECDGRCTKDSAYAGDIWVCKRCPDVQLCTPCYELLKKEEIQRFNCHPKHEFLHIPSWSDDVYKEVGKGNVRVTQTLDENNRLVGGDIVTLKEWLKTVRKLWSLPPPEEQEEQALRSRARNGDLRDRE